MRGKITERHQLFSILQTGFDNPDYPSIEIYWEIFKPLSKEYSNQFIISNRTISNLLTKTKESFYFTHQTIRTKLLKMKKAELIDFKLHCSMGDVTFADRYDEYQIKLLRN